MTIITGTGRSGTSFLIHLLTNLGLDTGWTKERAEIEISRIDGLRGGIEHNENATCEYVKNPNFMWDRSIFNNNKIDRVIISMRNLDSVCNSREYQHKNTHDSYGGFHQGAHNKEEQKRIYQQGFYDFINFLTLRQIPFTIINFELFASAEYLYDGLDIPVDFKSFEAEHAKLYNKDYIRF